MGPQYFYRTLAALKSKPDDAKLLMKLAQSLGLLMGGGEPQPLAEARSAIDCGLAELRAMNDPACTRVADVIASLQDAAAAASMAIETRLDNETIDEYMAKPPYSLILPVIEAETMRLSALVTRTGLAHDVVLDAVCRLREAHLAEAHGKPDPLVRITPRGCQALERLRAKHNAPPAT